MNIIKNWSLKNSVPIKKTPFDSSEGIFEGVNMLLEKLKSYSKEENIPMHMPGHKRNTELLGSDLPYELDITEITDFDYLHHATGILKKISDAARSLFHCGKSFPLINGSTCGILAAIRACTKPGDTVLMARNCHKSVYNAVELCQLNTEYLLPEWNETFQICGSIQPQTVEKALCKNPGVKLVILTSPTYEGVISNIKEISEIVHKHGLLLFVDEAHGAHLHFYPEGRGEALDNGADIVVSGLHKTLPALTQCALLNTGKDFKYIDAVQRQLEIFESSSPSYILLASIDRCLTLLTDRRKQLFTAYEENLHSIEFKLQKLKKLKVLGYNSTHAETYKSIYMFDKGKLVISTSGTNYTGTDLASILRGKYHIETEMTAPLYVIAMTSVCDSRENLHKLADALLQIDKKAEINENSNFNGKLLIPERVQAISKSLGETGEFIPLQYALGSTSLEYIFAYPPGMPLIAPGERVSKELLELISIYFANGISLQSTFQKLPEMIYVKET